MTANHPSRAFDDIELLKFATLKDACLKLADDAAAILQSALAHNDSAFIAVPGGTSPSPFFHALREKPLDWPKVRVTLTDERWVDGNSPQSNSKLVREALNAPAHFTPPITMKTSSQQAAEDWDFSLRHSPVFDLVVLGMGDDGHFASLFPGGDNLEAHLDLVSEAFAVAIPDRDPQRLSLTLRAILRTQRLAILLAGEKKSALLQSVLRGENSDLPIAALLRLSPLRPTIYLGAS